MAARSPEQMLRVNGVDLCTQTFGSRTDPAVLLIAGATASMDWWEDEFCERLADAGRWVIRFDNRDTGRSTSYPAGNPGYTGMDMVTDVVGVLDALSVARAHLVGVSAGGATAMEVALDHPERVASLTLIATSALGGDLPPPAERIRRVFAEPPPEPDWSDRVAVIDYVADGERAFAGTLPFEEQRVREIALTVVDRTTDMAAATTNHWILEDDGVPIRPRLGQVGMPTLVLHGTEDPLFPFPHGEALAREIPDARLVPLPGMGHEMPPPALWDVVIPAIVQHTGR